MENETKFTFDTAVLAIVTLASSPSNDERLAIYGLYKQATIGDINIPAPSYFDFAGSAKWNAWDRLKGRFPEQAKVEYVDLVVALIAKYGQKT